MHGHEFVGFSFWWIFPLLMFVFCFLMMFWRRGSWMCGLGYRRRYRFGAWPKDSAMDILERRYASGEISREEYEDMSKVLVGEGDDKTS